MNDKLKAGLLVGFQFIFLGFLALEDFMHSHSTHREYLPLEIASVVIGISIILLAAFVLRPSLKISPIPKENSKFITVGIYKYLRHPMYLGVILIGFGMAGFANRDIAWLYELLIIIDLNLKARFEDSLLVKTHPESFHYQLHTSGMIPCTGSSCRKSCKPIL